MLPLEKLTTPLEGSTVALEPLRPDHVEELWEAAQAPEIWTWLPRLGESREPFDRWLELSFEAAAEGREGTFATREIAGGRVVGSSRFLNVRAADGVVEIGWTWLHPSAWGSGANVEAKLLMMGHAFETLGCVRVEFKTDARNERSRAALAALPARFEGILRNHLIMPDVGLRDSAYFSVIDSEWSEVKANLERRLAEIGEPAPVAGCPVISLRYSSDPAELPLLEPLWNALQEHHVEVTPDLGAATPKRSPSEAWRIRRSKYEHWLEDPASFFVIADAGGEPAGYAFVTIGMPYASWAAGERLADLETLSVLPRRRGEGVGAALIRGVWTRLAELDVEDMQIVTTKTNAGAQRFYERHGFAHRFNVYYGKAPR
jgi:RimJ/RimL family protein N-acetyltransferase